MSLTNREKRLIILLMIVSILALYYQYIIYPRLLKINELKANYMSMERRYNSTTKSIDVSNIDDSIKKYERQLALYDEYIPEYSNIEDFIVELYKYAETSGIKIQSIQFDQEQQGSKQQEAKSKVYKVYPMIIDVKGSYTSIANFVTMIQNSRRLTTIKGVSLSRSKESINAIINVNIYYQKDSFMNAKMGKYSGKDDPFKPLVTPVQGQSTQSNGNLTQTGSSQVQQEINKEITNQLKETINSLIDNIGKK